MLKRLNIKTSVRFILPLFIVGICLLTIFWGAEETQARLLNPSSETLIWPISGSTAPDTANISSPFGPRWQASQNRYDYHSGIDVAAPINTPVHVITDGLVTDVGWLSADSGLSVIVFHPGLNLYSAYLHLNSANVVVNQQVTQGEVIGLVGNSGTTEFMHLHFEIRLTHNNYPFSTRNPMGYLPHPEISTPSIHIQDLQSAVIYSPTVSLVITATRSELDVNQIRVILQDKATGTELDNQLVDFNLRTNTGDDTLNQNGIELLPSHFNTSTLQYELTANFLNLHGFDAFTLTAQVSDLAGNTQSVVATAEDTTPPEKVTTLSAVWQDNGQVKLTWVAPGDSGSWGAAASYEIRYSNEPLNSFTWLSAFSLPNPPTPLPGRQLQIWVPPISFADPVYFALKAVDPEGNLSLLSNSAQASLPNLYLPLLIR